MISSMTGYGKGNAAVGGIGIQVEIKSLNHRFCDVSVKAPRNLLWLENEIKKKVGEGLQRGKVDVFIALEYAAGGESLPTWNRGLARRYMEIFAEMKKDFGIEEDVSLALLASQKDVLSMETPDIDARDMEKGVLAAVSAAVDSLKGMRRAEGEALCGDLEQRLETLRVLLKQIEGRAPEIPGEWQRKLLERLQKLDRDLACDPQRVAQEVAFFADRCDVSEEIQRLISHFSQFADFLNQAEAVGRQLDFLVQEMGRELNTLGSKGNDAELSRWVVAAKGELEKIREQVQNVM
ncbi:MAG: YicC family protein [Deltaproteobacteria bacterium]|nr:YicC family protein [Deltaproteobacteria bacterium]